MPVANVKSGWVGGRLIFEQVVSTAHVQFGVSGTGLSVFLMGDTDGSYVKWDESVDDLIFMGDANLDLTATMVMIDFKAGTASTKAPSADTEAGWINIAVDGTTVYVPYYASG